MGVCSLQDFSSAWEKIYHYHANTRLWSPVVNALELGHILSKAQSQFFVVFFFCFFKNIGIGIRHFDEQPVSCVFGILLDLKNWVKYFCSKNHT